ncbi:hypothetical protein MHI24_02580 [Paenibacillus sp. FSL K6-1096]|uniref:hypothetical protein n=1 Tax=Paenibacillus sp. FSL K6-1096 TaxID=2921460 RepID=UPI0030EE5DB5
MLMVTMFFILAVGCMAIDLPSLKGRQRRRDRLVYFVLWIGGLAASVCTLLGIKVPSPLLFLAVLYKPFNDLVSSWF